MITSFVGASSQHGQLPDVLRKAAANGLTERVEQIIAKGANVNTVDSEGWLALSRAAANTFIEETKIRRPNTPFFIL